MNVDFTEKSAAEEPLLIHEVNSFDISDHELSQISKILLFNRGFNLSSYKDRCVRRRIAIRIRANHCETVQEYCNLLLAEKNEIDLLLKVLTIHVSHFFRNPSTFEKLRKEIIPHLFTAAKQQGRKALRFWSLGCSSGEEPYSLALIIAEYFADENREIPVTIEAIDVDQNIITIAEKAVYHHDRLIETPLHLVSKHFVEDGLQYRLVAETAQKVQFKTGDMFNSLIYSNCDLLLCRNVLIYFTRKQQEQVLANLARAIGDNGFLVLGKSEAILGESRNMFRTVCPVERIYRSNSQSMQKHTGQGETQCTSP